MNLVLKKELALKMAPPCSELGALKKEPALKTVSRPEFEVLKSQLDALCSDHDALRSDHDTLRSDHDALCSDHDALCSDHDALRSDHDALRSDHDTLRSDHDTLRSDHDALRSDHDALKAEVAELKPFFVCLCRQMILNDARKKIYCENPFIATYPHCGRMLLSEIRKYDDEAFCLSVQSLSTILDPYDDIRELGNEAAHIAADVEKVAAIMSDVNCLSDRERDMHTADRPYNQQQPQRLGN